MFNLKFWKARLGIVPHRCAAGSDFMAAKMCVDIKPLSPTSKSHRREAAEGMLAVYSSCFQCSSCSLHTTLYLRRGRIFRSHHQGLSLLV